MKLFRFVLLEILIVNFILFYSRYISGVNVQYEEIEMTVPVLTQMKLLKNNMINKQMCFYLNKKHQENPPTPIDKDVKIEKNEEMTVYVHTFGG